MKPARELLQVTVQALTSSSGRLQLIPKEIFSLLPVLNPTILIPHLGSPRLSDIYAGPFVFPPLPRRQSAHFKKSFVIVLNCVPLCLNNEFFHKRHARDLIAKTKKGFQPPSARFYFILFFFILHMLERETRKRRRQKGEIEKKGWGTDRRKLRNRQEKTCGKFQNRHKNIAQHLQACLLF